MSQIVHDWPGFKGNINNPEYANALTNDKIQKFSDEGKVQSAVYNPKSGIIHVTTDGNDNISAESFARWPKVMDLGEYKRLKALSASGQRHANSDQVQYNFIAQEYQDQANRFYAAYKARGAAVITSTEFPQISVTSVSQALINKQSLVAMKYNLLNVPEKLAVPDSINIVYPEYNNTTQSVRVGYKENESIDTSGYGTFTSNNVQLKKAGAGLAFTEEFYMRQTTVDIQSLLLDKIALDFQTARYNRIATKLAAMTNLASTAGSWSAYTAGNLMSTNRPYLDINLAYKTINGGDKLATVDTIISNSLQFYSFYSNTWIRGTFTDGMVATPGLDQVVPNPPGITWANQWIINEDVPDGSIYFLDHRRLVDIEGPRKTQQINTYNPDQTIFIQKEWFDIVVPGGRTTWGRVMTGA